MKKPKPIVLQPWGELVIWLVGCLVVTGVAWGGAHLFHIEPLFSARLWFGLAVIYLVPGVCISFAVQLKHLAWPERLAWGIGAGLLCMPSLLFLLTAHGLPFTPLHQLFTGFIVSLLASAVFVIRLNYGTTSQ